MTAKYIKLTRRIPALFLVLSFLLTPPVPAAVFAAQETPASFSGKGKNRNFPVRPEDIRLPEKIGRITEIFQGEKPGTLVLVQDAHAIPDAQRKIRDILDYVQQSYGVTEVLLEGASERLDAQIFRSFPARKDLETVIEEYVARGEVAGGAAAAILNQAPAVYQGIEDWTLYQKGLEIYRAALEQQEKAGPRFAASRKKLEKNKEAVYSSQLLAVDRALSGFESGEEDFAQVLQALAKLQAPEKNSAVSMVLEEIKNSDKDQSEVENEVRRIAEGIREKDAEFSRKYQAFRTSQISTPEFALYLTRFSPSFSPRLASLINSQKKISAMEGTETFREFEAYASGIKKSLIRTREEKILDEKSRRLALLEKFLKLELSREEWEEVSSASWAREGVLEKHFEFYRNAEKRDEVFFKKITDLLGQAKNAVLVTGGFHARDLMRKMRAAGISFVLVMPEIEDLSGTQLYREQMQGKVSWQKYLRFENGRASLYQAFVRALRDRLLLENPDVKGWRDQIVRDLVKQEKATELRRYTFFLDELLDDHSVRYPWQEKVQTFIAGLRQLQSSGRLTESNVTSLLKPSNIITDIGGPAVLQPSAFTGRAEVRVETKPVSAEKIAAASKSAEIITEAPARSESRWKYLAVMVLMPASVLTLGISAIMATKSFEDLPIHIAAVRGLQFLTTTAAQMSMFTISGYISLWRKERGDASWKRAAKLAMALQFTSMLWFAIKPGLRILLDPYGATVMVAADTLIGLATVYIQVVILNAMDRHPWKKIKENVRGQYWLLYGFYGTIWGFLNLGV